MKRKGDNITNRLIGAVVTGTKPWNSDYNVGLVIEQARTTESFKIMWMNSRDSIVQPDFIHPSIIPMGKVVYTWEHPTSVAVLSGNECYG